MKKKTLEGFWAGLGTGALLALIINIFLVWGGGPRGMFRRIDDNKKEIAVIKEQVFELEKRLTIEENHKWYGK